MGGEMGRTEEGTVSNLEMKLVSMEKNKNEN